MVSNPLSRVFQRLGASNEELESEARRRVADSAGATLIKDLQDRQAAKLRGTITVLTMKPRSGTPWLEAEFTDGSGAITLIWMGRRDIPGIRAGRELMVTGRVSCVDGQRRLYNPYYELIVD